MNDLHGRFRRLERLDAPDLWNEAVARASELPMTAPRRASGLTLILAAALLLVALAAALAIGARFVDPSPVRPTLDHENGMIVAQHGCGRLIGLDHASFESRELVPSSPACTNDYLEVKTAWSADGQQLAYVVSAECGGCPKEISQATRDSTGAWVYDARTGASRHLHECPEFFCEDIDISSDGSLVAYVATTPAAGRYALMVVDVASGGSHRIELPGSPGGPTFSPDGTRVAVPVHGGTSGLHVVDVGGIDGFFGTDTLESTLLYGPARVSNATWSPDGAWIAFDQVSAEEHEPWDLQQQGTSGIWIVRADGSDRRLLASGPAAEGPGYPTWSPDSASVAYITTPNQGRPDAWKLDLWTVAIDGGQPARIYESDCCFDDYRKPAWSPDGEWIAFGIRVPGRGPESGILVLRPDGSEAHLASAYVLEPVWQPLPLQPPSR